MSRSVQQTYPPKGTPHMSQISETRFTHDELKLISRALNTTSFTSDVKAAQNLATRIYRENFRLPGIEPYEPPLYKDTDSLHEIPLPRGGHADFCNKDHVPGHTPCARIVLSSEA